MRVIEENTYLKKYKKELIKLGFSDNSIFVCIFVYCHFSLLILYIHAYISCFLTTNLQMHKISFGEVSNQRFGKLWQSKLYFVLLFLEILQQKTRHVKVEIKKLNKIEVTFIMDKFIFRGRAGKNALDFLETLLQAVFIANNYLNGPFFILHFWTHFLAFFLSFSMSKFAAFENIHNTYMTIYEEKKLV